jgi:hypothetical protein
LPPTSRFHPICKEAMLKCLINMPLFPAHFDKRFGKVLATVKLFTVPFSYSIRKFTKACGSGRLYTSTVSDGLRFFAQPSISC